MTTLFVTHPACLNHLTPAGHPERPDRLRAIDAGARGRTVPVARARRAHRTAEIDDIALCHPREFIDEIARRNPERGPGADRCRHHDVAGQLRGRVARRRRRRLCGRRGDERTRPPTRSARCARPAIMPRPCGRWAFACSTAPRSRRAMRRRSMASSASAIVDFDVHHGNGTQEIFWSDPTRDVLLDPRNAALSRHRRAHRARRAQHHRQRAAARRRCRRGVPRRVRDHDPAAAARVQARTC